MYALSSDDDRTAQLEWMVAMQKKAIIANIQVCSDVAVEKGANSNGVLGKHSSEEYDAKMSAIMRKWLGVAIWSQGGNKMTQGWLG